MTELLTGRTRPGGALADSRRIVRSRDGKNQVIGWVSNLDKWAEPFQESETRNMAKDERRKLANRLRASGAPSASISLLIRRQYNRPARNTVLPFVENAFATWIGPEFKKRADRELEKEMAK
jgi:hypothetical protein